ncbi:unnamed protein product [Gadus morhua 'NCC']
MRRTNRFHQGYTMAAMHWEARRRQSMLDRRMARDKQRSAEKPSGDDSTQSVQREPTAPPADGSQCPDCQRRQQSADIQYGAKIPNRYTSLHYKQQW